MTEADKATVRHERQGRNYQYIMKVKMNKIEWKLMWGKQKELGEKKQFWIKHSLKKKKEEEKSKFLGPNLSLQALHC